MPDIDPNVADGLLDVPEPVVPADTESKEPQGSAGTPRAAGTTRTTRTQSSCK
jgi:hypothetical protein